MIVWLASYPRCGNTLLRTLLKKVFDISSYNFDLKGAEEEVQDISSSFQNVWEHYGHVDAENDFDNLYKKAVESEEKYFFKTHLPPMDDFPAIYVIRDGRKAVVSYYHFMQKFFKEEARSITEIILGNDFYKSWSHHYNAWDPENRKNTLFVRYEDIMSDPDKVIEQIGSFLEMNAKSKWENPFDTLHKEKGEFFREGKLHWDSPDEWTEFHDELFYRNHSELMQKLGYIEESGVKNERVILESDFLEIEKCLVKLISERDMFSMEAEKRLNLINELDEHIKSKSKRKGRFL